VIEFGEIKSSLKSNQIEKAVQQLIYLMSLLDFIVESILPEAELVLEGRIFSRQLSANRANLRKEIDKNIEKYCKFGRIRSTTKLNISYEFL
jgi:hypothetical protein